MALDQRFWDVYMQIYDLGVATLEPYRELHRQALKAAKLDSGMYIVDAGCGTGELIRRINASTLLLRVCGLELSPAALAVARMKIKDPLVKLLHMNVNDAGWPDELDEPVDRMFSINALYLLEPKKFLETAFRAIKPGGKLILANPWDPNPKAIKDEHDRWLAENASEEEQAADAAIAWSRPVILVMNELIAQEARDQAYHFLAPDELRAMVEQAGFVIEFFDPKAYAGTTNLCVAERP